MADSTQDKTEQATGKKRDEAKSSGQIAYSKDLTAGILFLAGIGMLRMAGEDVVVALREIMTTMFRLPMNSLDVSSPGAFLAEMGEYILMFLVPVFLVGIVATLGPGLLQTKLGLSLKKLKPELTKLDPIKGIKKIFSLNSLVTVIGSLLKIALVGIIVWVTIEPAMPRISRLAGQGLGSILSLLLELVFLMGFRVGAGLLAIGFFDMLYRIWKNNKDLMMTKEDVKEERKKSEGDPRIKGKIREVQRAMALQRMRTDLEGADVVIRNPTHFAVALRYERGEDTSPKVVAKGRALMALTIIRLAEEYGIEVVSNKPLARELYRSVKLGDLIPDRLFKAVAAILAMVYRKKQKRKDRARGIEAQD